MKVFKKDFVYRVRSKCQKTIKLVEFEQTTSCAEGVT
jgi:hypothetical protein